MKSILLKTPEIVPSQNFVKPDTIRMILDRWINCNKQGLPPKPLVRVGKQGKCIAIDGHTLLVISDLFDRECEVFVVESAGEALTIEDSPGASMEAVIERNRELAGKFEKVDNWAGSDSRKGNVYDNRSASISVFLRRH